MEILLLPRYLSFNSDVCWYWEALLIWTLIDSIDCSKELGDREYSPLRKIKHGAYIQAQKNFYNSCLHCDSVVASAASLLCDFYTFCAIT
jgi:hypothetical protein